MPRERCQGYRPRRPQPRGRFASFRRALAGRGRRGARRNHPFRRRAQLPWRLLQRCSTAGLRVEPGGRARRGPRLLCSQAPRTCGLGEGPRRRRPGDEARALGYFQRPPPEGMPEMLLNAQPPSPREAPEGIFIKPVDDLRRRAATFRSSPTRMEWGMRRRSWRRASSLIRRAPWATTCEPSSRQSMAGRRPGRWRSSPRAWPASTGSAPRPGHRGAGGIRVRRPRDPRWVRDGRPGATLQASQMGTDMWRSLGFVEVTRYRRYLAPAAQPAMSARKAERD